MNAPDLMIFDLDGTLLDTLAGLADAFNTALTDMGCPVHPADDYRYMIGMGARVAASRCLPEDRQSNAEIERCLAGFRAVYGRTWQTASPYPGISEMLAELSGRLRLTVLSNKDQPFTSECVDHFFPNVFSEAIGHGPGVPHKPNPAGAMKLINAHGSTPSSTWMIGDTATDMQTAAACRMTGIGVLWGFRDRQELIDAAASKLIQSPRDLVALLQQQ